MLERLCGPNVITIEGDVLPAERSDMGKQKPARLALAEVSQVGRTTF